MMLDRARLLVLCLLFSLCGCQDWRNRIDRQILDCGEDVRGSADLWIKVLDPQGEELPEFEALDARPLAVDGTGTLPSALAVSKKHCVRASDTESWVVRSRATDRSWSVLVHTHELPWDHRVRLEDSSQQSARLQCPDPWVNDGRILLPLVLTGGLKAEALALSPTLAGPEGRLWAGTFGLQNAREPLAWPRDWPDGMGRLVLKKKNLLQADTASEESCALIVDRVPPNLELTPAPDAAGNLDLRPGSLLRLRMVDAHPGIIRWCLGQENACADETLWNQAHAETSMTIPEKGRWFVKARAVDAAGNVSSLFSQAIDVIQSDVIQVITSRVDQALAEKATDGWQAGLSLQQALQDYKRLVLPKEQDMVKNKLIDGILGAAPSIQERQRVTLKDSARKVWALQQSADSPWLVLTEGEVSLWSKTGDLLSRVPVVDAEIADWSESRQALALATRQQVLVLALQGKEWTIRASLRLSDIHVDGTPADVKWIPGSSQLAVTILGDLPAILDWRDGSLDLVTRLDVKDARIIAVKPGGDLLAVAASDQVSVWQKNKGDWQFLDGDERPLRDLRFTAATSQIESKLLILTSDGRVISWSPGLAWKEVDKGVPGEIPTELADARVPQYLQAWADGSSGLFERGGRFYQWSSDPNKTSQLLELSGFNWQKLRLWKVDVCRKGLWMLDDRSLSFWQWIEDLPGFEKSGEWAVAPDKVLDFVSNCVRDNREFITIDSVQSRLRFWSQRGPLPKVWNDAGNVLVARFLPGLSEGESLFTSGFGGVIRAWDLAGKKLREFVGHSGQVNEVRYVPELNQFLSSAEDSTSRLWSPSGNEIAALKLDPKLRVRDGAILLDAQHIVTSGKQAITLWTYENKNWQLTITIPLAGGERAHRDSIVRLPARAATAAANTAASASPATGSSPFHESERVLVKVEGEFGWRGIFIRADGNVSNTEPGLPVLEKLRHIQWTRDGRQIALVDAKGSLQIYREESEGWVASDSGPIVQGSILQLAFSPDGLALAVQVEGGLEVWENQDGWLKIGSIPLANELDIPRNSLFWTADSARLLYSQSGLVRIHDRHLNLVHQFQAFPNSDALAAVGVSSDPEVFAVAQKKEVHILDLNLTRLQAALCAWGLCTL